MHDASAILASANPGSLSRALSKSLIASRKSFSSSSWSADSLPEIDADQLIEDYRRLIKLSNPEIVPYPDRDLARSSRLDPARCRRPSDMRCASPPLVSFSGHFRRYFAEA
jgi:hypothetical protein